jgi:hypothetical protein
VYLERNEAKRLFLRVMSKLQKILSFYSIIVVTALVVGAPFFQSRAEGLFILVLFAPVAIFFWLKITHPEKVDTLNWSLRLVVVLGLLSSLTLFGYYLSRQNKPTEYKPVNQKVPTEDLSPISSQSGTLDEETLLKPKDDLTEIKNDIKEIKAILNAKGLNLGITDNPTPSPEPYE